MRIRGPDGSVIEFPDGTPAEEIRAAMARRYGGPGGTGPRPSAPAVPQAPPGWMGQEDIQRRALGLLPSVGGLVGGIGGAALGAPGGPPGVVAGGIAGAGALGAGGEALRQRLTGERLDPSRIGIEGAKEGTFQAVGGLLAKGAGAVARPVMRRALGVGKAISGKVKIGSAYLPDPVETALQKGIRVSPGGAVRAGALRKTSAQALREILQKEELSGRKFSTFEVTKHVRALLRSDVVPNREKQKVLSDVIEFYRDKGRKLSPTLLQDIKRYYQRQARSIYRAGEQGAFTLADQPHGQFAEQLARGAREQLERIPGVAPRNLETMRLIGAEKAVRAGVQRPPPAFELFRPGTYPMVSRLAGPRALSETAIFLNSPAFQTFSRQSPRAAAALVQQLLYTAEPDVTDQ